MFNASTDILREAVESTYGGKATFVQSVPVYESFKWQAIWSGSVQVFDLAGCPTGVTRAYAWASESPDGGRRFNLRPHIPPITGPREAVRAVIAAEEQNAR
jgi:hypothetical protein